MQPPRNPRKTRKTGKGLGLLVFCALLVAALIIIGPKEPMRRALNVAADGTPIESYAGLVISEVMSANTSALPDENGRFPDWVEIYNSADHALNLDGVSMSNRPDKVKFIFPAIILQPGERLVIFCDGTNRNQLGQPLHAKFKLSSTRSAVYLFDTAGRVITSLQVPTLNMDEVYALMPGNEYAITEAYTPGYPNTQEGHEAYMASYAVEQGALVINELMAAARSGLRDEDGELSDWIELHNRSDKMIPLSGLFLSDNPQRPSKWPFPEDAYIGPGGYYLVFASGKDRPNPGGYPHTNFSLAAEGETVILTNRVGQLLDRVTYETLPADHSYGRIPGTDQWQVYTVATPGAENSELGQALAERYLRAQNPTGVIITELMSSNDSIQAISGQPPSDWVELTNTSDQVHDMSGWGLSDNINWPRKWRFPQGVSIWPGESKIILLDKSKEPGSNAAQLHASFALKRAGGEVMTLSDPDGRVLDRIILPEIPTNISYGRTAGQDGFFYYDVPTPGAPNAQGFAGFAARPEMSMPGGLYQQDFVLTLTAQEGAQVRYTLDGSIPTLTTGHAYQGPIPVNSTCVVRARAFLPGLQPSEPVTATYVMKTYYTMPVVCLTADPDELWNPKTGMYATGEGIDLNQYKYIPFKNPTPTYRTHGKIQRPGYAEMFSIDGSHTYFSQGVTFGLIGQYSLDMPQKSFKVTARARYGDKYFRATLFEDRPFEEYKSFVLRVSGNDCVWTRMADGIQSRLVDKIADTTVVHQAWRPVIVYLNGQYWGHYNLRERVSRYFVAQHEGMTLEEADSITILEANSKAYYGSNAEYKALLEKAKKMSPGTNPEDMQYLEDNIDIDNYFDYMIFEAFFANSDTGNIRYYKVPGGRWRWILFDMDYGLFKSSFNGIGNVLHPKGTGINNAIDNTLIRKILENKDMQHRFLTRFGEIFQQLTTDVMLQQLQECYDLLAPEMMMHFDRWAPLNLKSISSEQPTTVDGCLRYWDTRVERMRDTMRKRPTYCYDQVKAWFKLSDAEMAGYFGPRPDFAPGATTD
ncbi:MAG: lamin tail domain-containing protein [Christensenellales bacterium]|jgi:hypothetical protein